MVFEITFIPPHSYQTRNEETTLKFGLMHEAKKEFGMPETESMEDE